MITPNGRQRSEMGPVEFYLTAYKVYLDKAPLLVQYITPEQGCLLEAGQLYDSPLILDITWNNPDSGQANTDTPLWLAMVTNGTVRLIKVAIVLRCNSWVAPKWMGDISLVTSYCPIPIA